MNYGAYLSLQQSTQRQHIVNNKINQLIVFLIDLAAHHELQIVDDYVIDFVHQNSIGHCLEFFVCFLFVLVLFLLQVSQKLQIQRVLFRKIVL